MAGNCLNYILDVVCLAIVLCKSEINFLNPNTVQKKTADFISDREVVEFQA